MYFENNSFAHLFLLILINFWYYRWKISIQNMWKAFSINDEVYMLKIINEDVYKIFISDLKDIWSKEYSEDEIITQFKVNRVVFYV